MEEVFRFNNVKREILYRTTTLNKFQLLYMKFDIFKPRINLKLSN